MIPEKLLIKEVAHKKLPDLRVVKNMHDRKALMAELADGFIALPGGYGTFEEFFEVLAWGQLGWHQKPFGLLDIGGFYRSLLEFPRSYTQRRLHSSVASGARSGGGQAGIFVAADAGIQAAE